MSKKGKQKRKPFNSEVIGLIYICLALLSFFSLSSFSFLGLHSNHLGYLGYLGALGAVYLFGLGAYLIPAYLLWSGVRSLSGKKREFIGYEIAYFSIFLVSCCMLLTVFAESYPAQAKNWSGHIISETVTFHLPYSQTFVRHNLGGVPFYFLFADLPTIPLQRILSPVGCSLIFSSLGLVSFLLLTQVRLWTNLQQTGKVLYKTIEWIIEGAISKKSPTPLLKSSRENPKSDVKINLPEEKKPQKLSEILKTEKIIEPRVVKSPSAVKPQIAPRKEMIAIPTQSLMVRPTGNYQLPPLTLLSAMAPKVDQPTLKKDLLHQAAVLEETLKSFGIEAKVGEINSGPTITSFEVHPSVGVKVQKIKALENDIALNMQAKSIRIVAPIPGKAAVGVEIPAIHPQEVNFREMLTHYQQKVRKMQIPILVGKAINGEWVFADLAKMPHLLIAGATGSGKSVCINTIVMSIVMNSSPDEVKLLMVDPKKVELTQYSRLPHMIAPVITESHGAYSALQWLVKEMQIRYEILKQLGLRNISAFNGRKINKEFEASLGIQIPEQMPFIVTIIDEFADLMMVSSSDIETPIARIAQMARAVGIHLILATQRPSREVITGIIKANIPTRISFKVASRINSQIILDDTGAENLLGNGDLLFLPPGSSQILRAQGAYLSDEDINQVIKHLSTQGLQNYLIPSFDTLRPLGMSSDGDDSPKGKDPLYDQALTIVLGSKSASTTFLQRKLKIGYARAASLMDELETNGIIGPQEGAKPRRVIAKAPGASSFEEEDAEEEDEELS